MLCPTCGKESNNLRVCAFCQTPYPTDRDGTPRSSRAVTSPRGTMSVGAPGDPRNAMAKKARAKRWAFIGLLAAVTVGVYFVGRPPNIPIGVVMPNLIPSPMSRGDADGILRTVNGGSKVEENNGELTVRITTATFPERRDGQLALAQQYSRADELVNGKKRAINFLDPNGNKFARAEPDKGVVMTR